MPALANTTRAIARSWTQHSLPVARAGCGAMQSRDASSSSFDNPFKGQGSTKIPSFGHYKKTSGNENGPKLMSYFMVGTMGALASLGAKATVQGISTPHLPGAPDTNGTGRGAPPEISR
jgi:ubiquinol-cytochrome c reductase iron-sulfur subunit